MGKFLKFRVQLPAIFTRLYPEAIWKIPSGEKEVYLTFDDGPAPGVTPAVLDILRNKGVKATFFCVGENVYHHPEIFQQVIDDGHAVGNHTYNHLKGLEYTNNYYLSNVEKAYKLIGSRLFRPPYGLFKRSQYRRLKSKYLIIMWDVISCDYDPNLKPDEVFSNVVNFVRDGSIVTFHDSLKAENNVLTALPKVIDHLLAEGYTFKKIDISKTRPFASSPWLQRFRQMREAASRQSDRA